MTRLRTSPNEILDWIGAAALRRSDNLRLPSPAKAHQARVLWECVAARPPRNNGGDDAA